MNFNVSTYLVGFITYCYLFAENFWNNEGTIGFDPSLGYAYGYTFGYYMGATYHGGRSY